ncbi:MAG: hypothetical protein NTW29_03185 [Bacteroidetes bacterium]|nr:hypothetical protein [Bacteroidota bacterium]
MLRVLLLIFLFASTDSYGQDSIIIVKKIDSIWREKIKTTKQNFKSSTDGVQYQVWFAKKSKEILLVSEVHFKVPDEKTKFWIYFYHFRNGKLIYITKYNNAPIKDPRRKICNYYFNDENLVYKHEYKTSIPDIETEKKKAYQLKQLYEKQ